MSSRVVFLSKLAATADPEEFERFVADEVLPLARALPSVQSYDVVRIEGFLEGRTGALPFDYLDVAVVTDASAYEDEVAAAMDTPAGADFDEAWTAFVAEWTPVRGTLLG